ncbi:Cytochrome cd1-nitrite reductase-like C-terminal heme d1 [Penicillium cf. griseofulvum]|uniref:Cytochrome cd1-nitrite reductase-like C-terminal heme d1 n=1 Tax=Penicillium cf. griseofulvum TaxID=2972120 RepID=A0A9W9MQQ9_9EURO|nr:Cytochrome cd1-nitrite reductase-like C-terminal heme d1 [Penicillium cf. griseofulvum]KAJ5441287.1 Cytochrome cd1-nitrite reductase-like C-terminal heme d1 [Penicillium cf. griseofulvum]KAJ5449339.1 Cytochrome cd1-nitrite reductase-like C-terminal heme d1 [Penicillium cf. griseofulvum]
MHLQTILPILSALGTSAAITSRPAHLWATHYNGNVYSLTLKNNDLSISQTLNTCGDMPSWLTLDARKRIVYCSDESGIADPSTHGSLTALHVKPDGTLREGAVAKTVGGGVNSVIYDAGAGKKFLAIAHYEGSAISTFALPLKQDQPELQSFHFNLTRPGKVAQQDSPHPHEVFLDPTGSFIVSPDLGADLLRVYAIEDNQSGKLSECPSVNITFGNGPRHAVFWSDESNQAAGAVGETMLYLANEIGGTIDVFDVSYPRSGCLSFEKKQTMVPYPGGVMPKGATPAGIKRIGDHLYVAIRSDQGFAPSDSIVALDRSPADGSVELRDSSSALGKVPRTFVINRAGDLVAIGNQASATVAIVRRDPNTGDLGDEVAILQVGEPGKVGTAEGLSSVIWDE